MIRLKRFIQGQGLHEESESVTSHNESKEAASESSLTGDQAKTIYEEIINTPSSSVTCSVPGPGPSHMRKSAVSIPENDFVVRIKQEKTEVVNISLTDLMKICEKNEFCKLQNVLNSGTSINLNEQDTFGWTMLMCAACAGSLECVEILLDSGAALNLCDKRGMTATKIAHQAKKQSVVHLIQQWEIGSHRSSDSKCSFESHYQNVAGFCSQCDLESRNLSAHEKSISHLVNLNGGRPPNIHYGIPEHNKGYQLLLKTGWDKNTGLGPDGKGHKFPVKTILKRDREGLGNSSSSKKVAKITHFAPFDSAAVSNPVRVARQTTLEKDQFEKQRNREKYKEIEFRRQFL